MAGPRAEHGADLKRGGGDGLRAAGGRRSADGAAEGPAGGHDLRRRRVPDERAGAGDGQAPGAGDREHRLVGQRVRGDRGAPAAQVRSPGRHQVHEPGSGDAGRELRNRGHARDVRRRTDADAEACAGAGHSIGRGDPDRLPREQEVFDESGRPGEGRRRGLTMAMTETIQKLYVDGEWYETGETKDVTSPYDGSVVGRVAFGGGADATRAIDAAERAMRSPLPAHKRASVLDGVAALLAERRDEFARTIAQEAGKPIATAGIEVDRAVQTMTFSAREARRLTGETVPMDAHPAGEGHAGLILRVPIGIVAAISPFNFPLNLVAHKVGPGFAAGCAVVLKPAGATPLSALLLAQAFEDAGQPAGWLNVIVGKSRDIGDVLTGDERVRMITFTGSSEVGWGIRARANKKKVSLELGNSTPLIVLADADLDKAAAAIAAHGYSFAGQSCISIQRVYVEDSVHDELMEKLTPKVAALKVGDPLDADTQVGPVIDHENRDRIKEWVDEAVSGGAK